MNVTCDMQGGLGNIIFQLSAACAYAKRYGLEVGVNLNKQINCVTPHFKSFSKYRGNVFKKINHVDSVVCESHYTEPYFHYGEIPYLQNVFLHGYFQSYKYFEHERELILDLFGPTPEIIKYIRQKYGELLKRQTVALHVRRNDYLQFSHIHPPLQVEYFVKALKEIGSYEKLLVFSDDIQWCRKNISGDVFFVEGEEDYIDLYLMSMCNHNIISNSTFSWWGAWLNEHDGKKIVCPKVWFGESVGHDIKDLYPSEWIRV